MTEQTKDDEAAKVAADINPAAETVQDDAELWSEFEASDNPKGNATSAAPVAAESDVPFEGENDETKPEDVPAGTPATTEAAASDIWASAPPELKAAYDQLAAKTAKIETDFKSVNGRVSAYQKRYEDLARAAQPVKKDETADPLKAIEGLKQDYPELAEPLEKALEAIQGRIDNLDKAEEGRRVAAQTGLETLVDDETKRLEQEHPDWLETLEKNGAAFAAWVEDQPRRIREIAYRNDKAIVDAAGAAEVMTKFKEHLKPVTTPAAGTDTSTKTQTQPLNDKRERQLAGTASPTRQGGRPVVSGIPEDGDPEQIWKAFDAADQQRARA